jgi:succinoglycan biosynthesis transport protein ExoP
VAQYDIDLREYWRILKKRKLAVLLTTIVLGLLSTGFAVFKAPTPLYSSSCSIRCEKEMAIEGIYARTVALAHEVDIETVISLLKGYPVIKEVAERLGKIPKGATKENPFLKPEAEEVIANLQSKVEVSREKFTNIIDIKVTDNSPVFARDFAHAIASTYKDLHAEEQNKRSTEAIRYIADQLKEARQKLRESENEFNRFTRKNQLVSIDLQSENQWSKAKGIRDEIRKLEEAKTELNALAVKLKQFIASPSGSNNGFYSMNGNKQYQGANDSLVELLLKRDSLLEELTLRHPQVVELQRKIVEVARKMKMIAQLQINNIDRRREDLKKELVEVDEKTNELMEKKLEYDRLKRRVDSYSEMTTLLERKSQEASIRRAEKPEEITIVKPALLPTSAINPPRKVATAAMGVIIGLILGMLIAFIGETFDTSLGAIEDVEETLGTQVLGVISHGDTKSIEESLRDKDGKELDASHVGRRLQLISHFAPNTIIAEGFRSLRTNIQFRDLEKKIKTLEITSASPQEGKTMVSMNLAITFAQAGMKTLLVECDLRKPVFAHILGIDNNPGVTDVLLGNHPVSDVVRTITDIIVGGLSMEEVLSSPGLDNLNIITSGSIPPNPGELMDSKRLEDFIEEIKKDYDLVIFDTAPVLSTADPVILGRKMDTVLLVYRVGAISRRLLKRSMVQLLQVKCHVTGVVLNDIKADVSPDFQDFKYYKYYRSYGSDREAEKQDKGDGDSPQHFDAGIFTRNTPSEIGQCGRVHCEIGTDITKKRPSALRLVLLLMALGLMISGLLWQNGVMPIEAYLIKNKVVSTRAQGGFPEKKALEHIKIPPLAPVVFKAEPAALQELSDTAIQPSPVVTTRFPYSVRSGSFTTLKKVQKAVASLKKRGLDPYWCEVDLGEKGKWFRVFVGYFADWKTANEFKERNALSKGFIAKTAYAVQIGEYLRDKKLDPRIANLKRTDLSPYFIEDPVKGYRLLTGAFVTQQAAEELAQRIRETGTDCKVVLR